ncbi:Macrophage mannose receptor 1 [Labeo rohita]|uniref:Macrophage mannose receptor 1 n=1 Tax=Labeo rohita TaxID=84645 RepID=A0ABQ8MZW3_LABRO|nr:Macrophage mannose receptor 1 [Labeo rohita]
MHGGLSAVTRVHIHVDEWKNWRQARSYCRKNYKDLSTVSNTEENLHLRPFLGSYHAWIGMHRNHSNWEQFIWSDGDLQTNFYQWKGGQPNPASDHQNFYSTQILTVDFSRDMTNTSNFLWSDGNSLSFTDWSDEQPDNTGGNQNCVMISSKWFDYYCNSMLTFFCGETKFILVKEKKTWEEALQYCRTHHTDLASITNKRQLQLTKNKTSESQTERVWTGLLYLDGEWSWANNNPLGDQVLLSECPAHDCGARNIKNDTWEDRDYRSCNHIRFLTLSEKTVSPIIFLDFSTVGSLRLILFDYECFKLHTFFCYKITFILVKEKRTWKEAVQNTSNINQFLWSDGHPFSFSKWEQGQPNNFDGNQNCVFSSFMWADYSCNNLLQFSCYKAVFILVKEMKTWEEALQYCRTHYTDLASITTERQLQLIKMQTQEKQTDSV